MITRILAHRPGEGISTHTTVDEFSRDELSRFFSFREIDQLSHFLNEFSQSNETFQVKYCFLNIKYGFQHRKRLSKDARGRILCFGRIIYNKI